MTSDEILSHVVEVLQRQGRVSYRALKRRFDLDDEYLEDLKAELIKAQRVAVDEAGDVLVWTGGDRPPPLIEPEPTPPQLSYMPTYVAEKILTSKAALEGERKQVTVLFADLKGSMELLADRDPEDARQILDPVLGRMMEAVHRYEGTVNQVMGDGIMALFGAPLAHEDHAVRACYAALAMQEAIRRYSEEARRAHGITVQIRVGLNSGEVVVRAIGNDLHIDYSAIGQTAHLAARMEQLASPGNILMAAETLRLAEGFMQVNPLGPVPVKGVSKPLELYEVTGVRPVRPRLQVAAAQGLTQFVGRGTELEQLYQSLARAEAGHGQVVAGVGKSRLFYEFTRSHHTYGWLLLARAIPRLERAVGICHEADLPRNFPRMAAGLGASYTLAGRVAEALPLLTQALEQTMTAELRDYQAFCALALGEAQVLAGHLEEAQALAEQALKLARAHQERGHQAYALRFLGHMATRHDPLKAELAADYFLQALALAEELGMRPLQAHCHRGLGRQYATVPHRDKPTPNCRWPLSCTKPWT
jgi:class 3 adenylate cyclase